MAEGFGGADDVFGEGGDVLEAGEVADGALVFGERGTGLAGFVAQRHGAGDDIDVLLIDGRDVVLEVGDDERDAVLRLEGVGEFLNGGGGDAAASTFYVGEIAGRHARAFGEFAEREFVACLQEVTQGSGEPVLCGFHGAFLGCQKLAICQKWQDAQIFCCIIFGMVPRLAKFLQQNMDVVTKKSEKAEALQAVIEHLEVLKLTDCPGLRAEFLNLAAEFNRRLEMETRRQAAAESAVAAHRGGVAAAGVVEEPALA